MFLYFAAGKKREEQEALKRAEMMAKKEAEEKLKKEMEAMDAKRKLEEQRLKEQQERLRKEREKKAAELKKKAEESERLKSMQVCLSQFGFFYTVVCISFCWRQKHMVSLKSKAHTAFLISH